VQQTQVLDVGPDRTELSRRPLVAGAAAGLWSLLVGVGLVSCLVMLAWALSPNSDGDTVGAWRAAGYAWLGAHQVPLKIGDRPLTLLPLGAVLLGLLLTRRAARWAGQLLPDPSPREAAGIVAACALVYGAGGAGLAWLSGVPSTGADPVPALVYAGTVAAVGATWGIAADVGLLSRARARIPDRHRRTLMGALMAVAGLFAAGAVLVAASLVRHVYQVVATASDLNAGLVGTLALTVVGALCLPTLNIWALSVVVGPGFELGAGNGLNIFGGQVEILPALPVLAAIPATMPGWAPLLLMVPVGLGVLAGRIRWGRDLPTLAWTAESGAGLAVGVAVLVGGLGLLASGSLGGGRLGQVGPHPLWVAASAAGLVLVGFLAEAGVQMLRLHWDLHRAQRISERAGHPTARDTVPLPDAQVGARSAVIGPSDVGTTHVSPEQVTEQLPAADPAPLAPASSPTGPSAARRVARAARRSISIPVSIPRPGGRRPDRSP
jgi:hypothetical protein